MKEDVTSIIEALLLKKEQTMRSLETLRQQTDAARSELNRINSALRFLNELGLHTAASPPSATPPTIADMALEVLFEAYPTPLKALKILETIRERWQPTLARTSLSPPLSRLGRQNLISTHEGKWGLTEKGLEYMRAKASDRQ